MTVAEARLGLTERLRERHEEIEALALARVHLVADPKEVADPRYAEGLRAAVSAALSYALAGIEQGDPRPGPIPTELFAQARHAARSRVSLDKVLRRYMAGHALLADFTFKAAEEADLLGHPELQRLLGVQAALLDRLVTEVSEEYRREASLPTRSVERARAERVRRLLDGEPLDPISLGYELGGWHIGAVAEGSGAEEALREAASATDRRILLVCPGRGALWAWLGGSRRVETDAVIAEAEPRLPPGATLALGEPGQGIRGWRLTHRQAEAASSSLASPRPQGIVRYADVAVLSSVARDEVLRNSLAQIYLEPLAGERDDGAVLAETLRAYFSAHRQASAAAAALGVSRQTVSNRLHLVEERLGRPLGACAVELELALRLRELDDRRAR